MSSDLRLIDVALWEQDPEYAHFPEGARPKLALFPAGAAVPTCIRKDRRHLFKWSRKDYPQDQFWAEVVAYYVGELMGVPVPPTYAAIDSATGRSGALIEWFYQDGTTVFVPAGSFFQRLIPGFDRQRGLQHNLNDILRICNVFEKKPVDGLSFAEDWRQFWGQALIFDALINNTDRHQENWGFLFNQTSDGSAVGRFAPLFDNGTALGQELRLNKVAQWTTATFDGYLARARHHLRAERDSSESLLLIEGVQRFFDRFPDLKLVMKARLASFDWGRLNAVLDTLASFTSIEPLLSERRKLMLRILQARHKQLLEVLQ